MKRILVLVLLLLSTPALAFLPRGGGGIVGNGGGGNLAALSACIASAPTNSFTLCPNSATPSSVPFYTQGYGSNNVPQSGGPAVDLVHHKTYWTGAGGGGGVSLGSNEVWMLDWSGSSFVWSRIKDPSTIIGPNANNAYDVSPMGSAPFPSGAADAVAFDPDNGNVYLWVNESNTPNFAKMATQNGGDVWAFDPNAKTWTFLAHAPSFSPCCGFTSVKWVPSAHKFIVMWLYSAHDAWFDPVAGAYSAVGPSGQTQLNQFSTGAVSSADGNYYLGVQNLYRIAVASNPTTPPANTTITTYSQSDPPMNIFAGVWRAANGDTDDSNRHLLTQWAGACEVYAYSPSTGTYYQYPAVGNPTCPAFSAPNHNFWYVPDLDVFMGMNDLTGGIWVFKPGTANVLRPQLGAITVTHQSVPCTDQANATHSTLIEHYNSPHYAIGRSPGSGHICNGDTVQIAKGDYYDGFMVNNNNVTIKGDPDLNIGLNGVAYYDTSQTAGTGTHIWGGGCGDHTAIVCLEGQNTTLQDLEISVGHGIGDYSGGQDENAIRLTCPVNTTLIHDWLHSANIVFEGADPGAISVSNSVFEDTFSYGGNLPHIIYMGAANCTNPLEANLFGTTCGSFDFENSTVKNVGGAFNTGGYGIKSRCLTTTIHNSIIAMLQGQSCTTGCGGAPIQLPEGGTATITHNTIESGPQADTTEMIRIGDEWLADAYGAPWYSITPTVGVMLPTFTITGTLTSGSNVVSNVSASDIATLNAAPGFPYLFFSDNAGKQIWNTPYESGYFPNSATIGPEILSQTAGVPLTGSSFQITNFKFAPPFYAVASSTYTLKVQSFAPDTNRVHSFTVSNNIFIHDNATNYHSAGDLQIFYHRGLAVIAFANNTIINGPVGLPLHVNDYQLGYFGHDPMTQPPEPGYYNGYPSSFPWQATTGQTPVSGPCYGAGETTALTGDGQVNIGAGNSCYPSRSAARYAAYPAIPPPP